MTKRDVLVGHLSCYPCMFGEHEACRHRSNEPGYSAPDRASLHTYCHCERLQHEAGQGTCSAQLQSASTFSMHSARCGKPAKAVIEVKDRFSVGTHEMEVCGIHRAAHERRLKGDAKRAEESAKLRRKWARSDSNRKASEHWAERFQDEFGLDARSLQRSDELLVSCPPEPLYRVLSEVKDLLDEVYGDEHPLSG